MEVIAHVLATFPVLGNMIMGNSATLLFNAGINIDITPPTLMMGENLSISSGSMRTVCVPLSHEMGDNQSKTKS